MSRFILRRLIATVVLLWMIATTVFFLIHLIPGDPVDYMLGEQALSVEKDIVRKQLGLDAPIGIQYLHFLQRLSHGDLGKSLYGGQQVTELISRRFAATFQLAITTLLFVIVFSLFLGVLSAYKQNTGWDHGLRVFSLLGYSMPNFWLGPLLILGFAVALPLFPISQKESLLSFVLPTVTLGTALMAILSRLLRSSILDTMTEEFIVAARARGVSEFFIYMKHALKHSLLPIITILGLQLGTLLSGAIITETIFDWPGLGTLLVESIHSRNYPLVQATVLFVSFLYVLCNLLTDFFYHIVDPRIRRAA